MGKYTKLIKRIALDQSISPEDKAKAIESLLNRQNEQDGGPGSGNFGHKGRPGKRGGSGKGEGGASEAGSVASSSSSPTASKNPALSVSVNKPENRARLQKFLENTAHYDPNGTTGTTGTIPAANPSKYPRKAEKGSGVAGMVKASKITRAGDASVKNRVSAADSGSRFVNTQPAEGSAFNKPKTGRPTKELKKGTGATKLSVGDLYSQKKPDARHTINQYLDDNGNLTPEREELHAQCVENLFAGKKPTEPGKKKTFTMFGGGSASGKGGLSDPSRCAKFKSSFFTNGTPSKDSVATIDSDELKKDIPEYREMQETDPDNAAAVAHEESSAIAKRAMQAAFDNGYDCTLDGTGDGSVEGVLAKIDQARARGYEVNACYVTCPTEMAIERSIERGRKTKRNVPLDAVRNIHEKVSQIFPQVADKFDHVALFDTSQGGDPVLIAECERDKPIRIVNQKLYDAFIAKGKKQEQ